MIEEIKKIKAQIKELQIGLLGIMTGVDSFVEDLKDLELLDEEPKLNQNWEDMEEATKNAALKRARDIMKKDIQAEKIRQNTLEDEPCIIEVHEENGTPRTLYEE